MPTEPGKNHFGTAFFLTAFIILSLSIVLLLYGKKDTFLFINGHHHPGGDVFFKYYTHAGDGWMWAPVILFCAFFRRRYLIAVIAGVIISTALSQFLKRVVFVDDLRPITFLANNFPVHVVDGVKMNKLHSFPSGHTSAAFTLALLLAYLINKRWWSVILPWLALLVGYSRVYLGQHFLTDVLAGTCVGFVSAIFSLMIYRSFIRYINKKTSLTKRQSQNQEEKSPENPGLMR